MACEDKNSGGSDNYSDEEYTNRWIYDKMNRLYLWNENLTKSPNYSLDPQSFFTSILYKYEQRDGDRFSWIEEDKSKETKGLFNGDELGFDCLPISYFPDINTQNTSVGLFVTYVYEDSDAEDKDLKRGMVIYKVNGESVSYDNYKTILEDKAQLTLSVYNNATGAMETLSPFSASGPLQSPVFISKVLNVKNTANADVKVGYLMYNAFKRDPDEDDDTNFRYDIALIESIWELHNQGITEFVLDLRYNPGGYLTSAINLASALYPERSGKVFANEKYNKYFEDSLLAKNNNNSNIFKDYFLDKVYKTNVDIPKLNISRLFVIASEYSASASELVLHNLKYYMDVYHIGETTVGKDKASMTIKSDSERIKWQLQPLISRLSDAEGNGDYIDGLEPDYPVSEWEESYEMQDAYYEVNGVRYETQCPLLSVWKGGLLPLGDVSEPMLAEAISKITGIARTKVKSTVTSGRSPVKVPQLKYKEEKQRIIIDADRFDSLLK